MTLALINAAAFVLFLLLLGAGVLGLIVDMLMPHNVVNLEDRRKRNG